MLPNISFYFFHCKIFLVLENVIINLFIMKKITLLATLLLILVWGGHAQCIRTSMFPAAAVVSNNLGFPQVISGTPYTSEYSQITNLLVGNDYMFSCQVTASGVQKYITVTDLSNTVIAFGPSPLTVEAITSAQVRLHYSDNAECGSTPSQGHTITIQALLDCTPPLNLSVSQITTTNATFVWEPSGDETAWQVLVLANGTQAPSGTTEGTAVTVSPTYTHTTLVAANNYQFYVRANCGTTFSPWNGPLNFASGCDPVNAFSENFDASPIGQLPTCWAQVKNGTGSSQGSYARVSESNAHSPLRAIQMYSENTGTQANLILAAPQVANLAAGTHRLKFYAKCANGTQSIQVGTIDNTTVSGVFTEIETISITSTYTEYNIDYTGYQGTDDFIAIRHNGTQYASIFIDDLRWEAIPVCDDASEITIPSQTITASTAIINWNANGGETTWDVVYGPTTVTDPTTLVPISPAPTGDTQASLSGLTDNTTYKVWVRSVCSANDGVWIGPVTFKTACLPSTTINEDFDALAYGSLPDCWSAIKNGTGISPSAYALVTNFNYYSGTRTAQLYNADSSVDANLLLVTPALTNIATGNFRLKFYARSSGSTGSLQIGTVDNTSASGEFSEMQTTALTSTYAEYIVEFTSTDVTDSYIAFRFNSPSTYSSIFIDNIVWEPIPTCMDVTGIIVPTITANTATVNWTPVGSETQWDVVYGLESVTDPETLTPISPAPTDTPTVVLTELSDSSTYKVWVRSVCGTQNGNWIGPVTFVTPCVPITSIDENFDSTAYGALPLCWSAVKGGTGISPSAYVKALDFNFNSPSRSLAIYNADSGATSNVMLATPNLGNLSAGTHRLKFFSRSDIATGSVQVGTIANTANDAVFNELEIIDLTSTYTEYVVDFTNYTGTDSHIAFRHNSGTAYTIVYLDDIRWEVAPLCTDVTEVSVNEITTQTANVNWVQQGTETNWQVAYGEATVTDPTTVTPSSLLTVTNFSMTDLTPNTDYKVWVRSVCSGTENYGVWIGPISFSTQCTPSALPFTENFETAVTPQMPDCTTLQNLSAANNFITSSPANYGFDSKVLQYKFNCTTTEAANAWYFTKGLILTAGTEYSISYKYGGNSPSTSTIVEKLKVMYGSDANASDMEVELANHTFATDVAQTNEVTFVAATTGVYYFGFNVYSAACQNSVYIDDIIIEEYLKTGDFNSSAFTYYPNPVKNLLNLSYYQNIASVSVFNVLGQKVMEQHINSNATALDMSSLSSGTYMVKVTAENQTKTIKVVKE